MALPNPDHRLEAEMASKTLRQVKAALRKHVDGFVHALPQSEVETQSAQITRHVLDSPAFKQARSVGLYASFPDHEASTVDLARQVLQHGASYMGMLGFHLIKTDMTGRQAFVHALHYTIFS